MPLGSEVANCSDIIHLLQNKIGWLLEAAINIKSSMMTSLDKTFDAEYMPLKTSSLHRYYNRICICIFICGWRKYFLDGTGFYFSSHWLQID